MSQIKRLLIGVFLLLVLADASAQCPVANSCTPGSAPASAFPFGMGIYNVNVGSGATGIANATTSGAPAGYQDFSCTQKATILEGVSTAISVATNQNSDENVRVWIDLNNNGTFEPATELVFSSNNARTHTGTFTIPISASIIKNQLLRLRVSSDDNGSPIPTPCSTPKFGQVEDYGITILPNLNKPAADFTVNKTITCSPTVQFTNLVQNNPTTYLWRFGDGTTSTLANPTKTYASPGVYTVTLISCNPMGCDSLVKTNYVTYHTNVPVAASCTPATTSYCCGYGISKVTFYTMVNSSQNGSAGYEDFTCSKSIAVEEGLTYPVAIETGGGNNHDTWIYIDYNNNGIFETSELVFTKLNYQNPTGNILIPTGKTINSPLRMRIISDATGVTSGPCTNRVNGQAEDYTIIITQPKVGIASSFSNICNSLIQFSGSTSFGATSWLWDFGDGTTSAQQNPQHNYATNGVFAVKLKACNGQVCDSVVKRNYIVINKPCPNYCNPTISSNFQTAITKVQLNDLNNITSHEINGYGNYTHLSTRLVKGSFYNLKVNAQNTASQKIKTVVFIDLNRDGDFIDAGEELIIQKSGSLNTIITIPATASSGVTRMRVLAQLDSLGLSSCPVNLIEGEVEDYSLEILPVTAKPESYFSYKVNACNGLNVAFSDSSNNLPGYREWSFGDPSTGALNISSSQNPVHNFSTAGNYIVKLKTCNSFGCDSLSQQITVNATTLPLPKLMCIPGNIVPPQTGYGISSVNLNTINNITSYSANGYRNYTCETRTTLEQLNPHVLTVKTPTFSTPKARYVQVWIDFNNDGVFNNTNEVVLNVGNYQAVNSITIVPDMTAVLNQPLRMRVKNDFPLNWGYPLAPCTLPDYGEIEDYTVTIVPYTNKPVAYFSQDARTACGNSVQFRDSSSFFPTSWLWDFGDPNSGASNTSTLKNPDHTFSGSGNYNITLTVCNVNGCTTLTKSSWINAINTISMVPANCKPQTLSSCCNSGIFNVSYGPNPSRSGIGFSNNSGGAWEGYRDFSCSVNTVINIYDNVMLNINLGPASLSYNFSAWLDYNNNGIFEPSEKIFSGGPSNSSYLNLAIPATAVKGVYLRLRVMSQKGQTPITDPCQDVYDGQVEDYGVKIIVPPISDFAYDYSCSGTITFTDSTRYSPISWSWNFNDPGSGTNNVSILRNPTHTYSTTGLYYVTLKTCNSYGCHTQGKRVAVGVNPNINLLPVCRPIIRGYDIERVSLGNINFTTYLFAADGGYQDYSCTANTTLNAGGTYPLTIVATSWQQNNVQVWIDYNNNGTFEATERVMHSLNTQNHTASITLPNAAVKNTYLRMRVKAQSASDPMTGPCSDAGPQEYSGQVEDYAVMIVDPLAITNEEISKQLKVYPNPSKGTFFLEIPTVLKGDLQMEVQNLIGQKVAVKTINASGKTIPVDLSHLPKGLYLLQASDGTYRAMKKILIE